MIENCPIDEPGRSFGPGAEKADDPRFVMILPSEMTPTLRG
ncbi:hypothetical protein FRUB_05696 [Fimbriiglobus ruber]|uniref:Uncharacterized protein n=1 Tax=Fimbriiglobus ruber TaxID=1908690 RepID=A0A225DQJ0_9BACT|nr:hypothetical protein FRUB_05696 [Fimbriiglobus ruber]